MRDLKFIIILLISLLILLIFVVKVSAVGPQETAVPIPTNVMTAPMGNVSSRTISQMDTIYWGETIDMRQVVGWDNKLIHVSSGRIVDVSSFTRRILVDPEIFTLGEWDKWAPYHEGSGNNVAFYVEAVKTVESPGIAINNTSEGNVSAVTIIATNPYRPTIRHIADILIAKGDILNYDTGYTTDTKVWIFGNRDMLLDQIAIEGKLVLNSTQTESLGVGVYHLIVQTPGDNTILEANYVEGKIAYPSVVKHIESPFRSTPDLEIGGLDEKVGIGSQVLYGMFKDWLAKYSDDEIEEITFAVETPAVEISSIDESYADDSYTWHISGYTNVASGTPVYAVLDEGLQTDRTIRANTFISNATGDLPGDMRTFEIQIPIDYDEISVGPHYVTVRSSFESFSTVPRWVYNIPEGQEKPIIQTKYSGGNLFVPTPTPEIITVRVTIPVEVIRTVLITPMPTPTPIPTPWYFDTPWFYFEILGLVMLTVLAGLWLFWKLEMI